MSKKPCRFVKDWGHYLSSHELNCRDNTCQGCAPCTHDDKGNLVRHCTARPNCGQHLGPDHPATCPQCIGKVRANITWISRNARLLTAAAIEGRGVGSEAAYLAGPAADPFAWAQRRVTQLKAGTPVLDLDPMDPHHPLSVLGEWEVMLREHYQQPPTRHEYAGSPRWTNLVTAAAYLFDKLTVAAQDPDVAWSEMATEIYVCRTHLEDILNTATHADAGAPCPACPDPVTEDDPKPPRLQKIYAHWCDRDSCEKVHDTSGASDVWRCPRNKAHEWREGVYRKWVADDFLTNSNALTASDLQMIYGINPSTLRTWATRKDPTTNKVKVEKRGRNASGQQLYDVAQARAVHDATTGAAVPA